MQFPWSGGREIDTGPAQLANDLGDEQRIALGLGVQRANEHHGRHRPGAGRHQLRRLVLAEAREPKLVHQSLVAKLLEGVPKRGTVFFAPAVCPQD